MNSVFKYIHVRFITYSGYHAHRYTERWPCRVLWSEAAYVDITVEDSLPDDVDSLSFCFLVSLWMKDLPVYTFTKDSTLTFFIIHCGFMYYISFSVMIQTVTFSHFCDFHMSSYDSRKHSDSPHGDQPPPLEVSDCLERNDGLHLLQHTGQTYSAVESWHQMLYH